jgi:tetratricopeptide (TPR) repeat protein
MRLRASTLALVGCFALGVAAVAVVSWLRKPPPPPPSGAAVPSESVVAMANHMVNAEEHLAALRLSAAYEEAKAAEALAPRDAGVQLMLGNIAYESLWKEAAERYYRQAAALDPGLTSAHANLALVLLDLGQAREAGAAAQRALFASPGAPFYEALLGRSYVQRGRARDGVDLLQRAVDNGILQAETYLGRARDLLGDSEAALRAFDAALRRDSADIQALYWRADCLHRLGRHEEARKSRAEHKRNLHINLDVARLRELLLVQDPDNVELRLELVGLLLQQGKKREASAALERAERLQPERAEVRRLRARLGPPEERMADGSSEP